MNFISQTLSNLTSGGKLYIFFQLIYLVCGVFFLYVQWQILIELKRRNIPYNNNHGREDYTYSHDLEYRSKSRDKRH